MLKKFVRIFGGDPNKRAIENYSEVIEQINTLEAEFEGLSDEALGAKTAQFRNRIAKQTEGIVDEKELFNAQQEILIEILPEAFAAIREASKRTIGLRHYDVQLIGGIALHEGKIAEMRTGEGKTLVATLPLYLNGLLGRGTHLITVNDYLARRDARWMAPIYSALGLSVGVLQMAARTENGKKAFIVDLDKKSPHEDQHQLRMVPRVEAYAADVTYGTNSEFGFDYLRDNMTMSLGERVQRGHHYAIVDEVDNVLIDEARTPLIISGPAYEDVSWYARMSQVVKRLRLEDYEINERDRTVTLTEIGESHVEELLEIPLRDPDRPEDVTPEQARLMGFLEQALRAQFLFRRNKDYLVQGAKVIIVDEFTGRLMPGRRWSDGLHQAVEAKEGVRVQEENVTYATITIQNYFRMYQKLAGMTGTAITEAEEFDKIYKLDVIAIPTNLEFQAALPESSLIDLEDRDEQGYKYRYYSRKDDIEKQPIFWKRKDYPDVIYRTEEAKFRAIITEILGNHAMGRPMLVGTTSVELSERLSGRLRAEPLRKLAQVLMIRDAWFEKNNSAMDGRQIPELLPLNAPLEQLQNNDIRKLTNEVGISFNPEEPNNAARLCKILNITESDQERLVACLKAGIPHQVLNARKHAEESQIIAGAGAFGAVTIATNMAGRGVDIKLGGELAEEIITAVNRVLRKAGHEDPYNMLPEDRRRALMDLNPQEYGIYGAEVEFFLKRMLEMGSVKSRGGLHVIGSERHEARRIDNQLRGRSARQGDPGSSRFYLSLEDELMRRFGGQQANDLMQRLKVDDAMPMEIGLVGRLVEQSQTRVEGANFDIRKHLLEYDDVLNLQRTKIYDQRDRIFTKDDLSEDVTEMLRDEVRRRIPEALKDEEGPWKLLAWLDQVQPPISFDGTIFPSYTLRLLLDHLADNQEVNLQTLLGVASEALKSEDEHLQKSIQTLFEQTRERFESQLRERQESLDTFIEGLKLGGEGESAPKNPREAIDELSGLLRIPVRLSPEQQRTLVNDPDLVTDELRSQLETSLITQSTTRLMGAIERRLDEPLEITLSQFSSGDWDALADLVMTAVENALAKRHERLLGDGRHPTDPTTGEITTPSSGQIAKDLESALARIGSPLTPQQMTGLLLMIPQGSRATFDKKTHRRVWQRTTRLTYIYYAARFLGNREPEDIAEDVLEHLEKAQAAIRSALGLGEWSRRAASSPTELDPTIQMGLRKLLGEDRYLAIQNQPLENLTGEERLKLVDELGRQVLTIIYRQLLLGVNTELWVEYLTQMEALRVSIGLEAYAQRDPLVQYKSQAFELFQNLLNNMRLGLVTRMFTYWTHFMSAPQPAARRSKDLASSPSREDEQIEALSESENEEDYQAEQPILEETGIEEPYPSEEEGETLERPDETASIDQRRISKSQKRRRKRR